MEGPSWDLFFMMKNILKKNRLDQIECSRGHKGQEYSYEYDFLAGAKLLLYFDIKIGDDDILINPSCEFIDFKNPLDEDLKKLTLAYLKLLDGVAVEAILRIGLKEFDYFLRVDPKISSFSYYSSELYKILEIGEFISKIFVSKAEETPFFDINIDGIFSDLSFSEQVEFFEEFLAKYVYTKEFFSGQSFEFQDLNEKQFIISYSGEAFPKNILSFIEKKLHDVFSIAQEVYFKHNQG